MPLLVILRIALVNCPTLVCASTLRSFCSLVSCRLPRGACRAGRLLVVPVPFEQAGEIAASIGLQAALDHVGSSPPPPGWDSEEKSRELEVQFAPPFEFQLVCVGSYGRVIHMLQDLSHGVKDLALHVCWDIFDRGEGAWGNHLVPWEVIQDSHVVVCCSCASPRCWELRLQPP